jgi:hypothetical protein
MTGEMVTTTAPTPNSATALDGFANLDTAARTASIVLGGTNDGSVQIVVTGFQAAAPFYGSTVHAEIDHTPFVNRTTAVTATDTVSTGDITITGDRITLTITNANATDGYRVILTPVAGTGGGDGGTAGDAGRSDAGAVSMDGGAAGDAGGSPGNGRDAQVVNEAGTASDASAFADATTGSAEGDAGRRGGAMAGRDDAGATSSSNGATGATPAPDSASGCSCRLGSSSGAPAFVLLGLLAPLVLRGARRASKPRRP